MGRARYAAYPNEQMGFTAVYRLVRVQKKMTTPNSAAGFLRCRGSSAAANKPAGRTIREKPCE
jgi:hypothetical protein